MPLVYSSWNQIWQCKSLRNLLLSMLDTRSLCRLRLVASTYSSVISESLFTHTRLSFSASVLTRPSRLAALSRIGHLIKHLTFSLAYSDATSLPPLLNQTGHELKFLYQPQTRVASRSHRLKYGSEALQHILTLHYPPLFHAATNVPAFIHVMSLLPNLQHLTITCTRAGSSDRYRRSVIDYALISLRIAVEQACLPRLTKLSLYDLHPAAIHYLRHVSSYGCTPSGSRRWRQIKILDIVMNSANVSGLSVAREHLLILDDYIRSFSQTLEEFSFVWTGRPGLCPFSFLADSAFASRGSQKLFGEVTSSMSPLPSPPQRRQMFFPHLRRVKLSNVRVSTDHVTDFVLSHSATVHEFDFINVVLANQGQWEDTLEPLKQLNPKGKWVFERGDVTSTNTFESSNQLEKELADVRKKEVVDSGGQVTTNATNRVMLETARESFTAKKLSKSDRKGPNSVGAKERGKTPSNGIKLPASSIDKPNLPIAQAIALSPIVMGVQRNHQMDAFQQDLADDPQKRASILKRAKFTVLKQLNKKLFSNSVESVEGMHSKRNGSCKRGWANRQRDKAISGRSLVVPLVLST